MKKKGEKAKINFISPKIEQPEILVKKVKVQSTGKQSVVQLPSAIVEALNIKKGDFFEFTIPLKERNKYLIKIVRREDEKN